ncbi:cysteine-rich motor neuron 1 protein-like [Neoarius graeffei]|uniref:cysteine-rich motor neuron 1 protein-like n=1 Tax=Neoarius graeffei TaxID=443677 RepID=UPI00298BE1D3|nr:cysteine-rich motor neuron 1 protein-like [Neoarius graeffei]
MVSSILWILARMLAFMCLLMPGSGYLVLREGTKCGAWIEGACESGLVCLPNKETISEFFAEGVCGRPPSCNCSEFQCPPHRRYGCRTMTINDPCGCCSQCGKPKGQVCGGPSWRYGNCERGLICALTVGLQTVTAPLLGVCKEVPRHLQDHFPEPPCPVQYGCNVHVGACDCYSDHSCALSFSYRTFDACNKILEADRLYFSYNSESDINPPEPEIPVCMDWSCEVQGCKCVCQQRPCNTRAPPLYEEACCKILRESGCQNASCPEIPPPPCPADSFLSEPYTEPGQCCPALHAMCTCNFQTCAPKPKYCPKGGYPKLVAKGNGHPGTCCDRYECVEEY